MYIIIYNSIKMYKNVYKEMILNIHVIVWRSTLQVKLHLNN